MDYLHSRMIPVRIIPDFCHIQHATSFFGWNLMWNYRVFFSPNLKPPMVWGATVGRAWNFND